MRAIYAFYADVFWLNCTLMNGAILLAVCVWNRQRAAHCFWRVACVSGAGGLAEILLLVTLGNYKCFLILSAIAVIPAMVFLVFRQRGGALFRKDLGRCYVAAFLIGGVLQVFENYCGIGRYPVWMALIGGCAGILFVRARRENKKIQSHFCRVFLKQRGSEWECTGLMDSGNCLRDPLTGKPVHIVGEEVLQRLGIRREENTGVVPYQSLGTAGGYAPTYRVQKILIGGRGGGKEEDMAVVALDENGILKAKDYQMILNASCLEQIRERS